MIIVIMGVSGSGKTTVGQILARDLGCGFRDADEFHPPANIEKMAQAIPLTDDDRIVWLEAMRGAIQAAHHAGAQAVFTCSALKERYRTHLTAGIAGVAWVYLKGSYELVNQRLRARRDHFFRPELLASQFAALEEPSDALTVSIDQPVDQIVAAVKRDLHLG